MSSGKSFDFKSFVAANPGRRISALDYLHAVYRFEGLSDDFVLLFAKMFWPDLKVVEGLVYLSHMFDLERYQELLNEGRKASEVQFWMNLTEITWVFDELSSDDAMIIAKALSKTWNAKMASDFGEISTPARAIHDDETGEVFVTIGAHD